MTQPKSPQGSTTNPAAATAARVSVNLDDYDFVLDLLWRRHPVAVAEETESGSVTFTVSYPAAEALAATLAALAPVDARIRPIEPTDWVANWRASAEPIAAGPFWVRLPELPTTAGLIDLVIDPGPAFGYAHASTVLALRLLARTPAVGSHLVADIGCGSGVLAIAAAKLGARAVDAVDIDNDAVAAATANAARNAVPVRCVRGSTDALTPNTYSLVLANLPAPTLRALSGHLVDLLADDGEMVLSGLLSTQEDAIRAALPDLELLDQVALGDWVALRFGR